MMGIVVHGHLGPGIWMRYFRWEDWKQQHLQISERTTSCSELCLSFPAHGNPFTAQQRASHCHPLCTALFSVLLQKPAFPLLITNAHRADVWETTLYIENSEKKLLELFQRKCECFSDVLVLNPANHTLNRTFWLAKWIWGFCHFRPLFLTLQLPLWRSITNPDPGYRGARLFFLNHKNLKPQAPISLGQLHWYCRN